MEKNVEISMLCQIYGKVLTEKQYEIITDYYNNDLKNYKGNKEILKNKYIQIICSLIND